MKHKVTTLLALTLSTANTVSLSAFLQACGDGNVFSPLENRSAKEKAEIHLRNKNYKGAIEVLEPYLEDNPDDSEARTLYSLALSKYAGIDPLGMLLVMQAGSGSMADIMASLPEPTQENLDLLEKSVNALAGVPPEQRTAEQNMQLAMLSVTLAASVAKKSVVGTDGKIDSAKVDSLSDNDAAIILTSINGGANAGNQLGPDSPASKISNIQNSIQNQNGESDSQKLKNYLKNSG